MTNEYRPTREEEAYYRLLKEKEPILSEAACTVLKLARSIAYKEHFVGYGPDYYEEEFIEAHDSLSSASSNLTDRDCEILKEVRRAAIVAAASIDPDDYETLLGHRASIRSLFEYHMMTSEFIEYTLWQRKLWQKSAERSIAQAQPLTEREPTEYEDLF